MTTAATRRPTTTPTTSLVWSLSKSSVTKTKPNYQRCNTHFCMKIKPECVQATKKYPCAINALMNGHICTAHDYELLIWLLMTSIQFQFVSQWDQNNVDILSGCW